MSPADRSMPNRAGWRGCVLALLLGGLAAALPAAAPAQTPWGLVVRETVAREGLEVTRIVEGSAAAAAGLQAGDVVLAAEGRPVASPDALAAIVMSLPAGRPLELRVSRQGWERTLRLAAPEPIAAIAAYGLRLDDLPPGRPPGTGVLVAAIATGGPADRASIVAGDVVVRLGGQDLTRTAEVEPLLAKAAPGQALAFTVWRDGWAKTLELTAAGAVAPAATPATTPAATAVHPATAPAAGPPTPLQALTDAIAAANAAFAAGNLAAAEAGYRQVIALNGNDHLAHARLALVHLRQQRPADAVAAARKALELGPPDAHTLINLGLGETLRGDLPAARAAYLRAIELNPALAEPYLGVANAHYTENDWVQAERYYRLGLARDPQRQSLWEGLAASCSAQNKHDEAVTAYRRAIEIGPPKAFLYEALGYRLGQLRRTAEAEQAVLQALAMEPADADAQVLLGNLQAELGKPESARASWQKAADLDPSGQAGQLARHNLSSLPPQHSVAALPAPALPADARPLADAPRTAAAAVRPGATATPPGVAAPGATAAAARASAPDATATGTAGGTKATVAIGDFQVKAAGAVQFIGDGLREMLLTSLHNSNRFVVVERMDIQGLVAEQSLSRTRAAAPGSAIAAGQMIVADLMVHGAVTEFGSEQSGTGLQFGVPQVPLRVGRQSSHAHMAIDVRLVDVATGRLVAAQRITGQAKSSQTTLGTEFSVGGASLPASFGSFRNTPMEQAIRECVQKATEYIVQAVPAHYLRHR